MKAFNGFPKISRFSREIIISEKIDGTNASVYIGKDGEFLTGSRTRWITPEDDNYGFARWAQENKEELLKLGVGQHFGEWWGNGCQRGYGLPKGEKRFSLFNVTMWGDTRPSCCHVVPVLYRGAFDTNSIEQVLHTLKVKGSSASPGFMKPEGIVIFHTQGNVLFKKTIECDDSYKGGYKSEC